jgi:hypothetical protein
MPLIQYLIPPSYRKFPPGQTMNMTVQIYGDFLPRKGKYKITYYLKPLIGDNVLKEIKSNKVIFEII